MSVKTQSRVWEHSRAKATDLLVLLAIADHADNDGVAWPGIPTVAQKSRISPRQCQRNVNSLIEMGEIYVNDRRGGRSQTTLYLVTAGLDQDTLQTVLISRFELTPIEALAAAKDVLERARKGDIDDTLLIVKGDTRDTLSTKKGDIRDILYDEKNTKKGDISGLKGDISGLKGDIAMSPEPMNHLEPSFKKRENRARALKETHFQKLERIGTIDFLAQNELFATRLTQICGNPHPKFVINGDRRKLAEAAAQLLDWDVALSDLDDFITGYWWGNAPPRYDQVTGDWGRFLTNKQQPRKVSKNGQHIKSKLPNSPPVSRATGLGEWTTEELEELRQAGVPLPDHGQGDGELPGGDVAAPG